MWLLVGAITTQYFHTDIFTSISVIVLSVISSILPDICHTQSKIGRRFRLTSFFVRILFGHRTFTHSLLFIIGISFFTVLHTNSDVLYGCNCYWYVFACYT